MAGYKPTLCRAVSHSLKHSAAVDLQPMADTQSGATSGAVEFNGPGRNVVDRERGRGEEEEVESAQSKHSKLVFLVRTLIGILLFLLVLGCTTFSKLTLVSLADHLRYELAVNASAKVWRY